MLSNIDEKIDELHHMLSNNLHKTSPYTVKIIRDSAIGKERLIKRPKFYPDQCVQWAVMQAIQDVISKGHYYYSCGSYPGKGATFAKRYIERWLKRDYKNTKYVLQIDITKYYPSINHDKLMEMFNKKIKCKQTLDIIKEIVRGGGEGLPIGNYTSQWFANFYLQETDNWIKQELKAKYYVRYMDDIVIFGSNKRKLHRDFRKLQTRLNQLGLEVKGNWQVFRMDSRPLDFLGFKFYRGYTTLRKRNSLRIARRLKRIGKKKILSPKDASAIVSYMGWIKHSNSIYFYKKHIKPNINIGLAKEVIRNESKKRSQT